MDDQEIKNLRHSFTTSKKEESAKVKKNQFGHTILGDDNLIDVSNIKVVLNDSGEIEANSDGWLDNDELISKLSESLVTEPQPPLNVQSILEAQKPLIQPHIEGRSLYSDLISELDDLANSNAGIVKPEVRSSMNGIISNIGNPVSSTPSNIHSKNCLNKDCMYSLPKEAQFCLKCGTPQMPKFCTECGYSFPGMEKFCPDCGTKR
jgi:hypothetical protein